MTEAIEAVSAKDAQREIIAYVRDRIAFWLDIPPVCVMVTVDRSGVEPFYVAAFPAYRDDLPCDQEGALYAFVRSDSLLRGLRILPLALSDATRS
jgi:hypothetical protein